MRDARRALFTRFLYVGDCYYSILTFQVRELDNLGCVFIASTNELSYGNIAGA